MIKNIQTKNVSNIMTARKSLSTQTPPHQQQQQRHTTSLSQPSITRVSHDEEIQLAKIIQRGSELNNIKTNFEKENGGREITRQEWAELAKVESPKELRRIVSDYRKAKNKLVMANMGLVHAVVRTKMKEFGRGSVSYEGISYEEMVQEGSLGLLRAAELFDPSRGLRFSTYATIWIKGVLGNSSLSEAITLPLREKNKWKKIQQAIEDISAEKAVDKNGVGYKPSEEEIGSRCGMEASEVKTVMTKMKHAKNVLSLDYQYDSRSRSGVETEKFDALSNDKNMMDDDDLVERLQLRADVVAALTRNLDAREARLMRLRYGLNDGKTRSINDCAGAMGISKARAQQLAAGCLKKLREADDAESLQEYLLSVA
jgi:RNA polymerase primary sigma factor